MYFQNGARNLIILYMSLSRSLVFCLYSFFFAIYRFGHVSRRGKERVPFRIQAVFLIQSLVLLRIWNRIPPTHSAFDRKVATVSWDFLNTVSRQSIFCNNIFFISTRFPLNNSKNKNQEKKYLWFISFLPLSLTEVNILHFFRKESKNWYFSQCASINLKAYIMAHI